VFLFLVVEAFAKKRTAGDNPWGVGADDPRMDSVFASALPYLRDAAPRLRRLALHRSISFGRILGALSCCRTKKAKGLRRAPFQAAITAVVVACDAKAQCLGGYEVALGVENVVDGWVCGEKSLG